MFHPMDPMGQFIHYFEKRFNIIEGKLGIENTGDTVYKKDNHLEELDISVKDIADLIEKAKKVEYNREWNGIIKAIKKSAEEGTSPILIYFNIRKYKDEMKEKLIKLGFDLEQARKDTPEEDAVSYLVTIKKEQ